MKLIDLLEARMTQKVFSTAVEKLKGFKVGFEFEFLVDEDAVDLSSGAEKVFTTEMSADELKPFLYNNGLFALQKRFKNAILDVYEESHSDFSAMKADEYETEEILKMRMKDILGSKSLESFLDDYGFGLVEFCDVHSNEIFEDPQKEKRNYKAAAKYVKSKLESLYKISPIILDEHNEVEKDYSKWHIEPDGSVKGTNQIAIELISPVFDSLSTAVKNLKNICSMLQEKEFATNSTCGLHIGVSVEDQDKLDQLKFIMFYDDSYVAKLFDRQDSEYAESHLKAIYKSVSTGEKIPNLTLEKMKEFLDSKLSFEKYMGVNLSHGDYFELRSVGNENYQDAVPKIVGVLNRVAYCFQLALDENLERKEYIKKLGKILATSGTAFKDLAIKIFGSAKYEPILRQRDDYGEETFADDLLRHGHKNMKEVVENMFPFFRFIDSVPKEVQNLALDLFKRNEEFRKVFMKEKIRYAFQPKILFGLTHGELDDLAEELDGKL